MEYMNTLRHRRLALGLFSFVFLAASLLPAVENDVVSTALATLPVHRGMAVILGGTADQALALANGSEFTVLAQMSDAREVEKLRQASQAKNWLGIRIYVEQSGSEKCLLADHLADMAIAADGKTPDAEIRRVLVPILGRGFLTGKVITKPALPGSDEWTHRQHAADNNQVSSDIAFHLPAMLQYIAMPEHMGYHNGTHLAGGSITIAINDFEGQSNTAYKPTNGKIISRNLYNGTLLWMKDYSQKIEPLAPNCALVGGRFYQTDGDACRVLVTDALTGRELGAIAPSTATATDEGVRPDDRVIWLGIENGRLLMLIGANVPSRNLNKNAKGWNAIYLAEIKAGRTLVMWDIAANRELWRHRDPATIDMLAVGLHEGRTYFYSENNGLVCLDAKGSLAWENKDSEWLSKLRKPGNWDKFPHGGTVFPYSPYLSGLIIGPAGQLSFSSMGTATQFVFSVTDGKLLWQGSRKPENNPNLFFVGDRQYQDGTREANWLDARTGSMLGPAPRMGSGCESFSWSEGMKSAVGHISFCGKNPCGSPIPIAGGILGHLPTSCGCVYHSMQGATAFIAADEALNQATNAPKHVLQTGSPLTMDLAAKPDDWPQYRGGVDRRGGAKSPAIAKAKLLWECKPQQVFPGTNRYNEMVLDWFDRPTPPVTAGGLAFTGATDGSLRAIRISDGKAAWTFNTGGAIYTAPAIADSRLFAGSADGWVYCLEAASGRLLWRWRGAPTERSILVYGKLVSSWPITGVIAHDGMVYGTAGQWVQNGVVAFALDAKTGNPRWTNWTDPDTGNGVTSFKRKGCAYAPSGALAIHGGMLWVGSSLYGVPILFDLATGQRPAGFDDFSRMYARGDARIMPVYCSDLIAVNDSILLAGGHLSMNNRSRNLVSSMNNNPTSKFMAYRLNAQGRMDLADKQFVVPAFYNGCSVAPATGGGLILYGMKGDQKFFGLTLARLAPWQKSLTIATNGVLAQPGAEVVAWSKTNLAIQAMALGPDSAVVVVCEGMPKGDFGAIPQNLSFKLNAYDLATGAERWSVPLPGEALINGLASSAGGTWVVAMGDGRVVGVGDR